MAFFGSAVTYTLSRPNCARLTATLASPPPKVATSIGDWSRRSNPGGLSRSMISPNVTTFFISCSLWRPARSRRSARRWRRSTRKSPAAIALVSSSAVPTPTATAPARIHSPALSSVTPPVGISLTCGSGARTSLMYDGPSAVAGKDLDDVGAAVPRLEDLRRREAARHGGDVARMARGDHGGPEHRADDEPRAGVDHARRRSRRRGPCPRRARTRPAASARAAGSAPPRPARSSSLRACGCPLRRSRPRPREPCRVPSCG